MEKQAPKRSHQGPVWLMFSAGGTISAITFPILIFILGILLPLGLVSPDNLIAFAHTWIGKLVILAVTIFPMWAGMHRVHHGLHDLKVHIPASDWIFNGIAGLYSIIVLFAVISL